MMKTSPCMDQKASSSPPSGILLLSLCHSCLLLSGAGFHTLVSHVSIEKINENEIKKLFSDFIISCTKPKSILQCIENTVIDTKSSMKAL